MAYRGLRRNAVPRAAAAKTRPISFPAPTRGWITNENLAEAGTGGAGILDNIFPTPSGVRLRRGSLKVATAPGPVVSMFSYTTAGVKKLFAATATQIFDVFNSMAVAVAGQNSGYYSNVQFATVGGNFLYAVNGTDAARLYDGFMWKAINGVSTPAITGPNTALFSHVWTYRNRVWFVQKDTMSAWYLPVDSIGGSATEFSLGGIFRRGGSLLFGSSWSLDAGNGIDEKCVFVSTEGEVAIYQGSDPSSASSWSIVGRYELTRPLGRNATMQAGGDLLVLTEVGIIPLSQAISRDIAALSLATVSRPIEPNWVLEASRRRDAPWEILKWPGAKMAIVAMPMTGEALPYCFTLNLETGAWARFTNWDVRCTALYQGAAYFGTSNGRIMQADVGSSDDGTGYNCDYLGLYTDCGVPSAIKSARMARATFRAAVPLNAQIDVGTDYNNQLPPFGAISPDIIPDSQWDTGLWDVAQWDAGTLKQISTRWQSVGRTGFAIAPSLRVLVNGGGQPDGELISTEYMLEVGGVVV